VQLFLHLVYLDEALLEQAVDDRLLLGRVLDPDVDARRRYALGTLV